MTQAHRDELISKLGGFIVEAVVTDPASVAWSQRDGSPIREMGISLHVSPNGVFAFSGKVEVGQNARTSIAQAIADELAIDPRSIDVQMADTDRTPFDLGTFGSRTTSTIIPLAQLAGARARETLLLAAARKFAVERSSLSCEDGCIVGQDRRISYADLAAEKPPPFEGDVTLKPPGKWSVLGFDCRPISNSGVPVSAFDEPDQCFAKVLRPPSIGAELVSLDLSGVSSEVHVFRDGDFVAVAASRTRMAEKAVSAIRAEWSELDRPSTGHLFAVLRGAEPVPTVAAGERTLAATYTCQYIAHVPLETRAAVARWDGERMVVHTCSQRPFGVRAEVATALGLSEGQVRVVIHDGPGYGGKHFGDAAVEAARIAKGLGVPIKLVWTREEEFKFAYFRPAGVCEISSGFTADGQITAWAADNYNSGGFNLDPPYDIGDRRIEFHESPPVLRQGSYRALASTFNSFARESHIDEIAASLGLDPVEFRLRNLSNPRLRAVLEVAAEGIGWEPGLGIACGTEKGSFVATAVEVACDDGEIRVVRAVTAFECGKILNPTSLRGQVEGCVIMGLGGALFEKIEFENGRITTDRLSRYRVPRFSDIPKMETILLDRPDLPSVGGGETPIIAIAPAIANAVFRSTGRRLRHLPLT